MKRPMNRRDFVRGLGAAALAPGLVRMGGCTDPGDEAATDGAAASTDLWPGYSSALVIDALAGPIQFNIPQSQLPLSASDLEAIRSSGITALNLTVGVVGMAAESPYEGTLARMQGWEREFDAHADVLHSVRTIADIGEAKRSGRLGIIHGFQDTVPFGEDLDRIAEFHGLGVRIVQLTYNDRNYVGSGSLVPVDEGLTDFGAAAVERMDDLGILIDLSHCGPRTTMDGIRMARRPVSITHTGCNAVYSHPRNKDDEALRATADGGGVVGIYLMPFLTGSGEASLADVVAHIEHALDICGEDHVGIGTDQGIVPLDTGGDFMAQFDAVSARRQAAGIAAPREDTPPIVPELNDPRRMDLLAAALADRGHTASRIEKLLGANWVRLFGDAWVPQPSGVP